MTTKPIDYIDAMPAADLRTNLRNAYATTSALNREIEMLHGMIRRQKAQRDELLKACEAAERALVNMHADRLWHEHFSWDTTQSRAFASNNPLPKVEDLRAAIAKAKGGE